MVIKIFYMRLASSATFPECCDIDLKKVYWETYLVPNSLCMLNRMMVGWSVIFQQQRKVKNTRPKLFRFLSLLL